MSALVDAALKMHARLEAALGQDAGSLNGHAYHHDESGGVEDGRAFRALLLGLVDAEDMDDTVGALRGCSVSAVQAIAAGGDPVYAIESGLAQILAVGIIYGQARS